MEIKEIAGARDIKQLLHFTRLENLDSILNHGLLTRNQLTAHRIPSIFTDAHRLDYQDATCLSISFPNYKMFYWARNHIQNSEWVVLGVSPRVLWEKDCAFCMDNAASADVSCIPIQNRKGADALSALFGDCGDTKRADLNLPQHYTTNPQAEVLVFDRIEPQLCLGVAFQTPARKAIYEQRYGKAFEFLAGTTLF